MRLIVLFFAILLITVQITDAKKKSKKKDKCKTDLIDWLLYNQLNAAASTLQMSDMVKEFSKLPKGSTAFIPTDEAVLSIIDDKGFKQKDFNKYLPAIQELLWYHVVPEKLTLKDLSKKNGGKFETMLKKKKSSCGENEITIEMKKKKKIKSVNGAKSEAKVVIADLEFCDVTVHVIDNILLDCKPKKLLKNKA